MLEQMSLHSWDMADLQHEDLLLGISLLLVEFTHASANALIEGVARLLSDRRAASIFGGFVCNDSDSSKPTRQPIRSFDWLLCMI